MKKEKIIITLSEDSKGSEYTHYQVCKENCADSCDCIHLFTIWCSISNFWDNWERWVCKKERHTRDGYRYKYEYISLKTVVHEEIERAKQG